MIYYRRVNIIFLTMFILACREGNTDAGNISIYKMIVQPSEYSGQKILVQGFLSDGRLFINEKSDKNKDFSSSLFLTGSELKEAPKILETCNKKYVIVKGTACLDEFEFGAICSIKLIHAVGENTQCYQKTE